MPELNKLELIDKSGKIIVKIREILITEDLDLFAIMGILFSVMAGLAASHGKEKGDLMKIIHLFLKLIADEKWEEMKRAAHEDIDEKS